MYEPEHRVEVGSGDVLAIKPYADGIAVATTTTGSWIFGKCVLDGRDSDSVEVCKVLESGQRLSVDRYANHEGSYGWKNVRFRTIAEGDV